ncbi:hypothetical protein GSI_13366 [Ganoderma sinense ZZ0214-1]|uniref:Uncharacterized protein n=1 Tax=Ganoderma sinense ZZ0214-1 TaxID=1077348 RepID=A0A2G8RVC6_9APHY|nr:hypothetical protein GSI_13366 [Ganoderma sinense ZZ0214-1]
MSVACQVYIKLLFKRGHGHPLREPEQTQSGGARVLIGDVGYLLGGGFYRLFNTTLPADDPSHERYSVPDGYQSLNLAGLSLTRQA